MSKYSLMVLIIVLLSAMVFGTAAAQSGVAPENSVFVPMMSSDQSAVIASASKDACTTIQSGDLLASDGSVIEVGFDTWGYNYQGKMFSGLYCEYDRDPSDCQPDAKDKLSMKWNDAWMSNTDCDDDGLLDRHYGYDSYIGSGAWLTNHQSGEYEGEEGNVCAWNDFVKIVAVPADATLVKGVWYAADGTEIGPVIWGQFAIIQEVYNDTCTGDHGLLYASPENSGLGGW